MIINYVQNLYQTNLVQANSATWGAARTDCNNKGGYTIIIGSTNEMADMAYFHNMFGGWFWVINF